MPFAIGSRCRNDICPKAEQNAFVAMNLVCVEGGANVDQPWPLRQPRVRGAVAWLIGPKLESPVRLAQAWTAAKPQVQWSIRYIHTGQQGAGKKAPVLQPENIHENEYHSTNAVRMRHSCQQKRPRLWRAELTHA